MLWPSRPRRGETKDERRKEDESNLKNLQLEMYFFVSSLMIPDFLGYKLLKTFGISFNSAAKVSNDLYK